MVDSKRETFKPTYSLDDIRFAAQQSKFQYAGRTVYKNIRNLGYTGDDVKQCISQLTSKNFKKCLHYENAIYDVYTCEYQKHNEAPIDLIYMKLRLLKSGEIQLDIGSFHT